MKRIAPRLAVLAIVAALLAGCGGNFEGGGWLPAAGNPDAKATFGFWAQGEGPSSWAGEFEYRDHGMPLGVHGWVDKGISPIFTDSACVQFDWEKQGKKPAEFPEDGCGKACVIDNGEGVNSWADDWVWIGLWDGPCWRGDPVYENGGHLGGGNIQDLDGF